MKEVNNIVVFPASALHRLGTGGGGVEIKHTHPEHGSEQERLEHLRDIRRTCAALVSRQRAKAASHQGRSA